MKVMSGYRVGSSVVAFSIGLAFAGVTHAQQNVPVPAGGGLILGEVDRCNNGNETPVSGISVGVDGGPTTMTKTDANGQFALGLAAGTYTVIATADDGSMANRPYVPVEGGIAIDIGILDLGMGAGGCGDVDAAPAVANAAPTPAPTLEPTPVPPTPTPEPAPPTATPVPDTSQPDMAPQPDMPPEPADESPPSDTGG